MSHSNSNVDYRDYVIFWYFCIAYLVRSPTIYYHLMLQTGESTCVKHIFCQTLSMYECCCTMLYRVCKMCLRICRSSSSLLVFLLLSSSYIYIYTSFSSFSIGGEHVSRKLKTRWRVECCDKRTKSGYEVWEIIPIAIFALYICE